MTTSHAAGSEITALNLLVALADPGRPLRPARNAPNRPRSGMVPPLVTARC
jgi:hypothetical protein